MRGEPQTLAGRIEERKEVKVWQELVIWQIPCQVFSQRSSPSFYQSYKVDIVIIVLNYTHFISGNTEAQRKKKGTATKWKFCRIPNPPTILGKRKGGRYNRYWGDRVHNSLWGKGKRNLR